MKNFWTIVFIVIVATGFYALIIRGIYGNPDAKMIIERNLTAEGGPFESGPELGRYVHLMSMVEYGTYNFPKEIADIKSPDFGYYDGRFYSFFAPGIAYLSLPAYILGRDYNLAQLFSYAFIALISVLSLIFVFKISREIFKLPKWLSTLAALTFAFGTTALVYSTAFFQHPVTTFLMISGVYAVWRYKQQGTFAWLWASMVWINYALGLFIDYPNAVLLFPVMVYFLIASIGVANDEKHDSYKFSFNATILWTSVFFIAITFFHLQHNYKHFDSWLKNSSTTMNYKIIVDRGILDQPNAAEIIEDLRVKKDVVGSIQERKVPRGLTVLLTSSDRGLFLYMPIFLFALYGIYKTIRKHNSLENKILLSLVALNIAFYSGWGDPWGGWAYGPRYLIPSMAILSIYAVIGLSNFKGQFVGKFLFFILFLYSSALALLGAVTTDNIPPKVQAIHMTPPAKYNFLANIDFLEKNVSGSFTYNNFFFPTFTLIQYYWLIFASLNLVIFLIIFIGPKFEKHDV